MSCGRGIAVLVAPLLRADGIERSLPDPEAEVDRSGQTLVARWRDGVELVLESAASRRGRSVAASVVADRALRVDSIGVRIRAEGATRLLVDGYQSWDWAGVRDATLPGHGWWGAVWGSPRAPTTLGIALERPPVCGALLIEWRQGGEIDALCVGEPAAANMGTGPPRRLERHLDSGDRLDADAVALVGIDADHHAGIGVPPLRRGDHRPQRRRVGWMSWNCLGPDVCGADVLEAATTLVPEGGVVLLDDGWMPHWGDWEEREDLDTSLPDLAAAVAATGRILGLWVAPFLVDPRARAASEHADMLLRSADEDVVRDTLPASPQLVLDASKPAVREHLAVLGRRLGAMGVGALKLDFLYAGGLPGVRAGGWSGVAALRAGVASLVTAYRAAAPRGCAVWACGAPAPPLVGLVDACRSGADAVVNIPTAGAPPPPQPWFAHGEAVVRAQERNLAARAWLWGSTVPPDVDAITLGSIGYTAPPEEDPARTWLNLLARSGGPVLDSDEPTGSSLPPDRGAMLATAQAAAAGTEPRPARPVDPLEMAPTPMSDTGFLTWPERLPGRWRR